MFKLLLEGTHVGFPFGGAPPGLLRHPQGPPGVLETWNKLQKFIKIIQKLHMHQNIPKYNFMTHFGPLGLPGGASGGQKVIWPCRDFFLVESIWSFMQNTLYPP